MRYYRPTPSLQAQTHMQNYGIESADLGIESINYCVDSDQTSILKSLIPMADLSKRESVTYKSS